MRRSLLPILLTATVMAFSQQAPPYDPGPGGPQQDDGAPADEPGRPVARLSVLSGDASVRRGDTGEWVAAALNAPLMAGDTLSAGPGSAAEIQPGGSGYARLAGDSEVRISEFEAGRLQLQLAKGLVTYRVLRPTNDQIEIATPLAAIRPLGQAAVRVEVTPDGSTRVIVRHGEVEVNTQRGGERVREGGMMIIRGSTDDPEFQLVSAPAKDQWDNWSDQRDAYLLRAQSPRYVSQDIYGAEDLDNYGRWSNDPAYGEVWTPAVPASWAPYREGRWVWEDYYGWTWIDASPWGWAPFHYGSWYFRTGFGWSWFPGHRYDHYWYRPALVGFFGFGGRGGFGVGIGLGNIGWIPLAPYERYRPWYGRGWGGRNPGFNSINIVQNTNITNVYRNSRYANGVTAVSGSDFQRGNFRNRVAVDNQHLQQGSLVRGVLPVSPGADHLRFSDRAAVGGPRADVNNQRFFSRMPSSGGGARRVPFSQQQATVRSTIENRGGQGYGASQRSSAPGWQRFGNPQAGGDRSFGTAQQQGGGAAVPQGGANRFEGPAIRPEVSRPDSAFRGQTRSLEVAPPIVHQRQAQQNFNGSPYTSSPRPNNVQPARPTYNQQPQFYRGNPSGAAPAPRGNSGGFGAPAYRSAPPSGGGGGQRSAPAPSFRGGGNGGGGGNSGGSHGGGGGHSGRR